MKYHDICIFEALKCFGKLFVNKLLIKNRSMKKLVLVIFSMFLFAGVLSAQHVAADGGKTYYDEAKTKLKEKKLLQAELFDFSA